MPTPNTSEPGALLKSLVQRHPRLFRGQEPRAFSDIPLGWLQIIDELLVDIDRALTDTEATALEITQIKEKPLVVMLCLAHKVPDRLGSAGTSARRTI